VGEESFRVGADRETRRVLWDLRCAASNPADLKFLNEHITAFLREAAHPPR